MTCKVTNVSVRQGKSQCLWSSCREGCTSDMYQCYQVRVQYIDVAFRNNTFVDEYQDREWKNLSRTNLLGRETLEVEVSLMIITYLYNNALVCPSVRNTLLAPPFPNGFQI